MIFSKKEKDRLNVAPVKLNGDDLPWVAEVKHLGNLLNCNNSMKRDLTVKKGKFIGKLNSPRSSTLPLQTPLSRY